MDSRMFLRYLCMVHTRYLFRTVLACRLSLSKDFRGHAAAVLVDLCRL
jgi:hypothetical protein